MKKVLFTGKPGTGKGTQAKLLAPYGFQHISTGDLIRNSKDSVIIEYRENGYVRGEFLSDKLIFELIRKNISGKKGYILDGAIRTLNQAKYALEKGIVDSVVYFSLNDDEAKHRILDRNQGRSDDNLEAIEKRLQEYRDKTEPVFEYLKKNFKFYEIDASPTIEEIHKEVKKVLEIKD